MSTNTNTFYLAQAQPLYCVLENWTLIWLLSLKSNNLYVCSLRWIRETPKGWKCYFQLNRKQRIKLDFSFKAYLIWRKKNSPRDMCLKISFGNIWGISTSILYYLCGQSSIVFGVFLWCCVPLDRCAEFNIYWGLANISPLITVFSLKLWSLWYSSH